MYLEDAIVQEYIMIHIFSSLLTTKTSFSIFCFHSDIKDGEYIATARVCSCHGNDSFS